VACEDYLTAKWIGHRILEQANQLCSQHGMKARVDLVYGHDSAGPQDNRRIHRKAKQLLCAR
jgi:hypothetical protein